MANTETLYGDGLNLPYSLEAEQAVLGSILIEPESINRWRISCARSTFICRSIRRFFG